MMRQEVRRWKEMERKWGERRGCETEVSNELKNSYFQFPNMGITRIAQSQHMHTNFSPCLPSHLFDVDVFLYTDFVQLYANLVCKLTSIFRLDYLFLKTIVPVSHLGAGCVRDRGYIDSYRCMRSDVCMSKTNSQLLNTAILSCKPLYMKNILTANKLFECTNW